MSSMKYYRRKRQGNILTTIGQIVAAIGLGMFLAYIIPFIVLLSIVALGLIGLGVWLIISGNKCC